jgi:response regulator NasT
MPDTSDPRLQVLIADERDDRVAVITGIVEELGHEVVARGEAIEEIGPLSRASGAEVALVGLGLDDAHALDQISAIVREAACPVIALLDAEDPSHVLEAAKRGVFAYIVMGPDEATDLQAALDITLRRFAEFHNLEGAFGRRAIIEQAKGILMERNRVSADEAFVLIRSHSQRTGQKLIDIAHAITSTYQLLSATPADSRLDTASNPGGEEPS